MWPSFVSLPLVSLCFWPELGTRHHCCDNVTLLSGHKIVGYCIVCISVVDTPFITKDLNNFHMFACHWSCFTWLHCRCPEAKQLPRAQLTVLTLYSAACDLPGPRSWLSKHDPSAVRIWLSKDGRMKAPPAMVTRAGASRSMTPTWGQNKKYYF